MNFYEAAIQTVCTAYEITPETLKGECRDERIVEARKWYCLLTSPRPLVQSGRHINRDHATVLHHRREMRDTLTFYSIYRERYAIMRNLFDKILLEGRLNECSVGVMEYREQWKSYRDLLSAAERARGVLESMSTSVTGEPCVVCESGDGGFHVIRVRDRLVEPLHLNDMLDIIRNRNK